LGLAEEVLHRMQCGLFFLATNTEQNTKFCFWLTNHKQEEFASHTAAGAVSNGTTMWNGLPGHAQRNVEWVDGDRPIPHRA